MTRSLPAIDVALVTYSELLDLFPDDRPLAAALRAADLAVEVVAWDDPEFGWSQARLVFLRSPWDYYRRPEEFLAWAEFVSTQTRLVNPLPIVRWNLDKRYLVDLAAAGLPVVPTARLERGVPAALDRIVAERGWQSGVVVKPAISADSWETIFVPPGELSRGQAHLDRLQPERDLLVQPFLASVETYGERCLVFFEGEYSHAVRKNALTLGGRWAGLPEGAPVAASDDEVATAEAILATAGRLAGFARPLYARVDLTHDDAGRPLLLEMELTEPTLFVEDAPPGALDRLVRAVARLARATGSDATG